jgi:transcriptional regulator with XRE-family HTH domain
MLSVDAAELIKRRRERHRLSQRALALRAGTDQAAISRIERGEISPTAETVQRLLAAMGERLQFTPQREKSHHDPLHVRALRARTPEERLELAISWNRLAGSLAEAGRRARGV